MNRRTLLTAGLGGALSLAAGLAHAENGFTPLYNGQDLTGWHTQEGKLTSWKANGDMISCVMPGGGFLTADKEYGDFELHVEYRIPEGGNSGIGIRYPPGKHPSTDGMEIQILDDAKYPTLNPNQRNGSIYTHVAPKAAPAKPPGEWNRCVIRCQGPHVQIWLNDIQIQDANLDDYSNSPGKGKIVLSQRPRKGCIGLQSHGDQVDFRNIEIKEL